MTRQIDWALGMTQTYELYLVDPISWMDIRKIERFIPDASLTRDLSQDTRGSATINVDEDIGEAYVRLYLVATQYQHTTKVVEKIPLGTYLCMTPRTTYNRNTNTYSIEAYTPLIELTENNPPLGYTVIKNSNIANSVCNMLEDACRAPIVRTTSDAIIPYSYTTEDGESWLEYASALLNNASMYIDLTPEGRVIFQKTRAMSAMAPIWTYTTDNSSILLPEIQIETDYFDVPNVLEVTYSDANVCFTSVIKNEDPNSPASIQNRGREIVYRDTNPSISGTPSQEYFDQYVKDELRSLSTITCKLTYTHGYCPVTIGDCVLIDYPKAGLNKVKALVTSQVYTCQTGIQVKETATFTKKLWE